MFDTLIKNFCTLLVGRVSDAFCIRVDVREESASATWRRANDTRAIREYTREIRTILERYASDTREIKNDTLALHERCARDTREIRTIRGRYADEPTICEQRVGLRDVGEFNA